MERKKYNIKNSRIWHMCLLDLAPNESKTLDNWTRYNGVYRETYYLNDNVKFLEVNHFNKTFKFFDAGLRKSNVDDFRKFYRDYLKYQETK